MSLDAASAIAVAAAVVLAVLIVAIVVAASAGACGGQPPGRRPGGGGGAAAVHDVERALGNATLVTYEQARAAGTVKSGGSASADEEEAPRCALCLSEFASSNSKAGGELVRVVSACGHFFHAECGVDGWLRARGTCPLCRAEVWTTLPRPPRPECPPLPPRSGGATVGSR
ncbi:E3 ubiquitin-protein ligase EL5-like [Miscanthus floridulus]|uniref:E3 ubiquitin-protein ligase EL5-like n=1 Tax=Miscanthus floridulus TaxID=154761 RepID=UPI00345A9A62